MSDFHEGASVGVCAGIAIASIVSDAVPLWLLCMAWTGTLYFFLLSRRKSKTGAS